MSEIEQNKQRNKKDAVQPDFIHVGVMRGGSTWLEAALREHPDVEMYKTRLFVDHDNINSVPARINKTSAKIGLVNEKLISIKGAAKKISDAFHHCKIIIVLRNPVDRLLSQYFLYKSNHIDDRIPMKSFVETHEKGKMGIDQGMYLHLLQPYFECFERDNLGFFLFDDLQKSPSDYIRRVYSFIEVDDSFLPKVVNKKLNVGVNFDGNFFKKVPFFFKKWKMWRFYRLLERFLQSDGPKLRQQHDADLRVLSEMFRCENKGLDDLIGRDTSHWYE